MNWDQKPQIVARYSSSALVHDVVRYLWSLGRYTVTVLRQRARHGAGSWRRRAHT